DENDGKHFQRPSQPHPLLHPSRLHPPTNAHDLPLALPSRLITLLGKVVEEVVDLTNSSSAVIRESIKSYEEDAGTLILVIGRNGFTEEVIGVEEVEMLGSEGFMVRSKRVGAKEGGATVVAVDGKQWEDRPIPKTQLKPRVWKHGNRGLAFGVYAALEELGFAFMHPLAPSIPPSMPIPHNALNISTSPHSAGWESHLSEWSMVCEWLLANRQNGFEWAMLESNKWGGLDERIVDVGHGFGVAVGVDVPIAFAQQHSFRLLRRSGRSMKRIEEEKKEIRESLDWIMKAGEFTHVTPQHMLEWMNCAADHAALTYNIPMHMKIHCSTGQVAVGFVDERTGEDINYNMLPYYASNNLGVLPHTVETYSLDDPAPTYGNRDFGYMREYLKWELKNGNRSVVFYPETSYWVSVDIDVPLFLPLYADRRLHDLHLIATDEDASPTQTRMDGQLIFSSGWEWGYWLNDVIAARECWEEALDVLVEWVERQRELMILGKVEGVEMGEDMRQRTGHGYLEGWDTWDDVSKLLGKLTQPDRLGLIEFKQGETWRTWFAKIRNRKSIHSIDYPSQVAPLLLAMLPHHLKDLWDDVKDAGRMTALRAKHVHLLYEYVFSLKRGEKEKKGDGDVELARAAVAVVREAHTVVARREPRYRVPASRIASWTNLNTTNPTAYPFTYLWTVHSLHLWWRDTAQALLPDFSVTKYSFCNIIDPVETVRRVLERVGFGKGYFRLAEKEPVYPEDIPHWREL
ncbi:hypothetical protein BC829DRAFT_384883, partial [Chytridium lagenaria]